MIFFKLFQKLLMPSTMILSLLIVSLVLILRTEKKQTAKKMLIVAIVCYYCFSLSITANFLLFPLEKQYQEISFANDQSEYTIVLLTGAMVARSSEVLRLYSNLSSENTKVKIIITGTNAINPKDTSCADNTRQYLLDRGVAVQDLVLELNSRNTFESAINVYKQVGHAPFILVTSAYHMPRSMLVFQSYGMQPIPAPTDFKINKKYNIFSLFPYSENFSLVNIALHEYLGIIEYKIKIFLHI